MIKQSDRSAAKDTHAHPRLQVSQVHSVDGDPERLQHHPVRFREGVGKLVKPVFLPTEKFPQRTILPAVPGKAHLGTEICIPPLAMLANAAGDGRVNRHAFARFGFSGKLVPEHKGVVPGCASPIPPCGEPAQVRATHANCFHPDQCLVRPRGWQGLILDPQVAGFEQTQRLHLSATTRMRSRRNYWQRAIWNSSSWRDRKSLSQPAGFHQPGSPAGYIG